MADEPKPEPKPEEKPQPQPEVTPSPSSNAAPAPQPTPAAPTSPPPAPPIVIQGPSTKIMEEMLLETRELRAKLARMEEERALREEQERRPYRVFKPGFKVRKS